MARDRQPRKPVESAVAMAVAAVEDSPLPSPLDMDMRDIDPDPTSLDLTLPDKPDEAFYSADFREFILPYDIVRQSEAPDHTLLDFLQSTYEAAANLAKWDRSALERDHDPKKTV